MAALDLLPERDFVALLGGTYEHSPWVAERTASARPFGNLEALAAAMQRAVLAADESEQLALIRAHPELIGKLAPSDHITDESRSEQAAAGLDRSSEEQMQEMRELNRRYRERFGFPFIIAVRGLSRAEIVTALGARANGERAEEFRRCLDEIGKIARLRLAALISTGR